MAKKALLIGINYPGTSVELRGCVNDVRRMQRCLTDNYGFLNEDITILIDTDKSYIQPTGKNIRYELEKLIETGESGDFLVFHYSGHGTRLPPENLDDATSPILYDLTILVKTTGFQQLHVSDSVQHVAALFFGGPDDREALSLCKWLANNAQIHLSIIQFVADGSKSDKLVGDAMTKENNEVLLEIVATEQTEDEKDRSFLEEFYNRFVTTGQVGFIEKRVSNRTQTLIILREIGEMYSLFVVGKNRGDCPMTSGMNYWEEYPKLGTVGDFLASSNMDVNASVLVVQRHRNSFDSCVDE